jgi:hypothetical protein
MMGACGSGPAAGVQNGFLCNRSTDVWGVALDSNCRLEVTWPAVGGTGGPPDPPSSTTNAGTYEATQAGGPTVCGSTAFPANTTPAVVATPSLPLPGTSTAAGGDLRSGLALGTAMLVLVLLAAAGVRRGRRDKRSR